MWNCAGIRVSDDKLLQSRVFAYSDAQRYRLGANYQLLPVNAPKCPYKNNHYEGLMNVTQRDEEVCLSFLLLVCLSITGCYTFSMLQLCSCCLLLCSIFVFGAWLFCL